MGEVDVTDEGSETENDFEQKTEQHVKLLVKKQKNKRPLCPDRCGLCYFLKEHQCQWDLFHS